MWGLLAGEACYENRLLVKMKAQAGKSCWNRAAQAPRRLLEITPPQHKTRFYLRRCSAVLHGLISSGSSAGRLRYRRASFCQLSHKARQLEAVTPQASPGNRFAAVLSKPQVFLSRRGLQALSPYYPDCKTPPKKPWQHHKRSCQCLQLKNK